MVKDYQIGKTLGKGAFSKVKLGTHVKTGEHVALKLLKLQDMDDTSRRQVEREIQALARVEHQNVIRLKHVEWEVKYPSKSGKVKDMSLVVLELAAGGELFDFLAFSGAFEEHLARTYFHQLISGLSECHRAGVAHRDLKPENILLDARFILKIADFGLSAVSLDGNRMRSQCGTVGYMAPEVLNGGGYDAFKADIWSAGVVLFLTLAGFPPFARPNSSDWWFDKLNRGRHDLFWKAHCRSVNFSESSKDLINKMLAPDPSLRITMEGIRQHPWFDSYKIAHDVLFNELQERKARVDNSKAQERFEKLAGQGEARVDGGDGVTVRDIGENVDPESEELPPVAPSMAGYLVGGAEVEEDGDDDEEVEENLPEAPEYNEVIAGYTQFKANVPPVEMFLMLKGMIRGQGVNVVARAREYTIHATVRTVVQKGGPVTINARVYRDGENSLVDFRRINGDFMEYNALFVGYQHRVLTELAQPVA